MNRMTRFIIIKTTAPLRNRLFLRTASMTLSMFSHLILRKNFMKNVVTNSMVLTMRLTTLTPIENNHGGIPNAKYNTLHDACTFLYSFPHP